MYGIVQYIVYIYTRRRMRWWAAGGRKATSLNWGDVPGMKERKNDSTAAGCAERKRLFWRLKQSAAIMRWMRRKWVAPMSLSSLLFLSMFFRLVCFAPPLMAIYRGDTHTHTHRTHIDTTKSPSDGASTSTDFLTITHVCGDTLIHCSLYVHNPVECFWHGYLTLRKILLFPFFNGSLFNKCTASGYGNFDLRKFS